MNDTLLILEAANLAAQRHSKQVRKGADKTPYINHPLGVAQILAREGGVEDARLLAAAILHDTVEDTQTSEDELRQRFGDTVTEFVLEVTDDKSLPKAERKRLQVVNAVNKSDGAKLIKLADKISNLRDILAVPPSDWALRRQYEYFSWAAEVVAGLRGVSPALEEKFDDIHRRGMKQLERELEAETGSDLG